MIRKEALIELRDKVKSGSCPLRMLNNAEFGAGSISQAIQIRQAFNGSLDAAKALHEAALPGFWVELRYSTRPRAIVGEIDALAEGHDDDLARAWLLVILEALIAEEGDK